MSITVTVPENDAVALQAVSDMFNTIARARVGAPPLAGCGCKSGLDAAAAALEGVEYKPALGPITQHCLDLAKEQNEAARTVIDAAAKEAGIELGEYTIGTLDPAAVYSQQPAAPAPPLADRIVPHLSGEYTSPTGQLAPGAAPAPPAPASIFPPAPTLDKNGLPWDGRINTSNQAQTQQGVWKRKPGLTDEVYAAVIAELRTAQGASVAPAVAPPAAAVAPPAPVAAPSAPAVEPPPNVPAPPAPDADTPQTISQLIPIVTQAINGGKITIEAVNAIIKDVTNGAIPSMPVLATAQQHIPAVYTHLKNAWSMA